MTDNSLTDSSIPMVRDKVTAIWTDVLANAVDHPDASFFELDGQSISAVRIVAQVERDLGVTLDIGELFEDPDLDEFVALVTERVSRSGIS